jgi:carbon-monoxide dehydrogenase large subunit
MLPVVVDPEVAMTGSRLSSTRTSEQPRSGARVHGTGVDAKGNVDDAAIDKAFAEADVVISQRMMNQRLVANAIEPRGVVAHYEPGKDR